MVSRGGPSVVRWKHPGQCAIRRVPRSAIRPESRELPVRPVWGVALEKANLHGGKISDGPSGIYSRTTGSCHALKIPQAQAGAALAAEAASHVRSQNFKLQGSSRLALRPTGVVGLRVRCGTRSRRRMCPAGSGRRQVGGSLCRRGGSWRSQPCRWSSPDEANRTPTTGELFNSVPVSFLASRSGRHRAEECPAYIREWIPAETEEAPANNERNEHGLGECSSFRK